MPTIDLPKELRGLGVHIVSALDQMQYKPTSAFWYYSDQDQWILCIAFSNQNSKDTSYHDKMTGIVQKIISSITAENILFAIVEPQNNLILAMSSFFVTEPDLIGNIEFKNNVVDNQLIRSVYAYRLTV